MVREIQVLIDKLQDMNPKFIPPADWKNLKKSRKIYLPETGENQNNYAGTILGQGGATQKRLETKSNCKISIRGKQSFMKRRYDYDPTEQTHVLVQAENDEDVGFYLFSLQKVWILLKGYSEVNLKKWMMLKRIINTRWQLLIAYSQRHVKTVENLAIKFGNAVPRLSLRNLQFNARYVMTSLIPQAIAQ